MRLHRFLASPATSRSLAALALACLIAGCATRQPAPVIERAPLGPIAAPPIAAAPPVVPAEPPPRVVPTYVVKRGDTLRVIAQDRGVEVRDLIAWNNLDNPNRLVVGQVLKLGPPQAEPLPVPGPTDVAGPGVVTTPLRSPGSIGAPGDAAATGAAVGTGATTATASGGATASPAARAGELKNSPKAIKQPYSAEALRDFGKLAAAGPAAGASGAAVAGAGATAGGPAATGGSAAPATEPRAQASASSPPVGGDDDRIEWMWPAKGRVVSGFSETATLKGIDISGAAGTPVVAAAAGKVVYAAAGLRGYGKLVIIKHNDTYLSAYAHNREILVKQGDVVERGQKIAEMGNTDADQVKLHFEIRRLGKPMDPARYLPPAP